MKPVIFLNSHPIQYFAPMYREMAEKSDLTVWYCSDESVKGSKDIGFGKTVKWDIPLLDGYSFSFIKNRSWKPSIHNGFWGLFNPGVIQKLFRAKRSLVIVHGWAYSTHILAILFGRLFGHDICLRTETPWNQERTKTTIGASIKRFVLKILFLFIRWFLYIGEQNKDFYTSLGVKKEKLIFTPYAVDNRRFREVYAAVSRSEARVKLSLPDDQKIILYSGKYISKKRPLDLLQAFQQINHKNVFLVFAGDGDLKEEMEDFIVKNGLSGKVLLTGFINQSLIPLYYRAANIFVMCSGIGETWGLSVNEAMNFGLPVIISDSCGSAFDLVENGQTGNVFSTGNIAELKVLLLKYVDLSVEDLQKIEIASLNKIDQYTYSHIITAIEAIA